MKTQCDNIREHLVSGKSITPIDALNLYGCFRLGARIADLKKQGMDIHTDIIHDKRNDKRYASYRLVAEEGSESMTHEQFKAKVCEYWGVKEDALIIEHLYSSYKIYTDPTKDPKKFEYDKYPMENKLLGYYTDRSDGGSMFTLVLKEFGRVRTFLKEE